MRQRIWMPAMGSFITCSHALLLSAAALVACGCQYTWPVPAPAAAAKKPAKGGDPRLERFDALARRLESELRMLEARIIAEPAAEDVRAHRLVVVVELRVLEERRERAEAGLPSTCPGEPALRQLARGRIDRARRQADVLPQVTATLGAKRDRWADETRFAATGQTDEDGEGGAIDKRLLAERPEKVDACGHGGPCEQVTKDLEPPRAKAPRRHLAEDRGAMAGEKDESEAGPGGVAAARVEHADAPLGVMREVRGRRAALRRCLPAEPADAGFSLTVLGRIDRGGAFRQPLVQGGLLEPSAEACIADVFRTIRVPDYHGVSRVVRVPLWLGEDH